MSCSPRWSGSRSTPTSPERGLHSPPPAPGEVCGQDECLAALEALDSCFRRRVLPAYLASPGWREGMRAATGVLVEWVRCNQGCCRLALREAARVGGLAEARRDEVLALYADLVDLGRRGHARPPGLSRSTAEAVAGAVLALLSERLGGFRGDPVAGLAPELMHVVVLPYLGPEAAAEELLPEPSRAPAREVADAP